VASLAHRKLKIMPKTTTAKTTLKAILENPKAGQILIKHGVPCMSCPYASFELEELEIGKVCEMYGLRLKEILKDLNNQS